MSRKSTFFLEGIKAMCEFDLNEEPRKTNGVEDEGPSHFRWVPLPLRPEPELAHEDRPTWRDFHRDAGTLFDVIEAFSICGMI
jgi:hypothetical protein